MDALRRTLLKGAGATGAIAAAVAAGVLKPSQVLASEYNRTAFEAKDLASALRNIGAGSATDSNAIVIKAPDIAENGAVVPVDVVSNLPNTISIAVLVDKNPLPLSGAFDFANGALPDVALRLKMGQTSIVEAVAKTADGKYYKAKKEVKVTVGGCGG
ncbi:MAG: thiosulfate oxidation carrier protein SoxY [Betaproteobacteria bacterium]|nr:thiosulfate oxidation carrier protein SoxY [Betaproteobacteria bacterium]